MHPRHTTNTALAATEARAKKYAAPKLQNSLLRKLGGFLSAPEIRKFRALDRVLKKQFSRAELDLVQSAFLYGHEAHTDSFRASGEPYITHPLEVAAILAQMKMDCPTIVAAILHDVIEDTDIQREDIEEKFGAEISMMVDGLSKLDRLHFKSPNDALRASYSKMFIAMARDIRLVFIKLADRLHNLRTISFVSRNKQERIALETLNLYVPLATRLGMHRVRHELEDMCLQTLHPFRYRVISEKLAHVTRRSRSLFKRTSEFIKRQMREYQIESDIKSRTKSVFGCHMKMQDKRLKFDEINDINAMRIIVSTTDACYRTLGVIHTNFAPVPGKFKDYIAVSKFNGYQSLHTTVHITAATFMEMQIRTPEMDRFADGGIASYWMYKVNLDVKTKAIAQANAWISSLAELPTQPGKPGGDLSLSLSAEDDIYVFSKDSDTVCLPREATALDFAYAIHTEIGHSSISAIIDKRAVPLHTPLQSGQTVAIVHNKRKATPDPTRLNYVRTHKARSAILQQLNQISYQHSVMLGRDLLNNSLRQHHLSLRQEATAQALEAYVQSCGYDKLEALYRDIALGNRVAQLCARSLAEMAGGCVASPAPSQQGLDCSIKGIEGLNYHLSHCCHPIPNDDIVGVQTRGQGLVIHRTKCTNFSKFQDRNPELIVGLEWGDSDEDNASKQDNNGKQKKLYRTSIRVTATDQKGALARISTAIADMNINIVSVVLKERTFGDFVTIPLLIEVDHRDTLARVIRGLRRIDVVRSVGRV
ncbi:MAG: RelA/SpoT family protein [Proteobacteria bacterium]|nr:RelA/SpoT family protein [Pseudomonadota bacterium]